MNKVEAKKWREYFVSPNELRPDQNHGLPLYYVRRTIFNPVCLFALLILILGLFSFFERTALLTLLTLVAFLYLYFQMTKSAAQGIVMRRVGLPDRLFEEQKVEITCEVVNGSPFDLWGLQIHDHFGPSRDPEVDLALDKRLRFRARINLKYKRVCDAGMGTHKMGPIKIQVSDPFGIFMFYVYIDELRTIEVLPKIAEVDTIPVRGSSSSGQYGLYELASRGLSVNFTGVRPYVYGDSLRHIAWKLSTKAGEFLVKEFEKSVNSNVTVILNLDPRFHVGTHAFSTWEVGKDVSLSVMSQQIDLGNSVQFFSNDLMLEAGLGEEHFAHLSRRIANLGPSRVVEHSHLLPRSSGDGSLLERYSELVSASSTLFYIAPFHERDHNAALEALPRYLDRDVQIFFIYIDPSSVLSGVYINEALSTHLLLISVQIKKAEEDLNAKGVRFYILNNPSDYRPEFVAVAREWR